MISNEYTEAVMLPPFDRKIIEIDIELAENVLKSFGHMIQKVLINFAKIQDQTKSRIIYEYIKQYCSQSLIELYFYGFTENPLNDIPNAFDNVEFVSLTGFGDESLTIGNDTVKLTDIFPAMQRLYISVNRLENTDYIKLVYPHLKHLQVGLMRGGIDSESVEEILMKNRQIQHLEIKPTSLSLLKRSNDILPNLEALSIDLGFLSSFDYFEEIRFRNVKRLSVSFSESYPANLVFDQLEEVQFGNLNFDDG